MRRDLLLLLSIAVLSTATGGTGCARNGVSGTLEQDTLWVARRSPYIVVDDLTVAPDATLTIEPGTTVLFEAETRISVRGQLLAEGTEDRRILFSSAAGSEPGWDGLRFRDTLAASRLAHADVEHASSSGQAIRVKRARLEIDDVHFRDIDTNVMELERPKLSIRNSRFADPGPGNEVIHGKSLERGDYLVIENNTFERCSGGDVIDFVGARRPGPVLQLIGNTFLGGEDEGVDLDGTDAHVEGNRFRGFHAGEGSSGTSNAISAADGAQVMVARNIFRDNDHAMMIKNDAFLWVQNNTIVGSTRAAIQLTETDRDVDPGRGAHLDGNIFWDNRELFVGVAETTDLRVDRSLLPAGAPDPGDGNRSGDPGFVDYPEDLGLETGSPAAGTGPGGLDMGAVVPAWAQLSGGPSRGGRSGEWNVWGPGITHYRYRLDDGPFGDDSSVGSPIVLHDLPPGTHRVEVLGRNSAGVLQDEAASTLSEPWSTPQ